MNLPILTSMAAVMNSFGLYPPGHPTTQQQLNQAYIQLTKVLNDGPLVMAISDDVLVLGDEPLYEENKSIEKIKNALTERGWEHLTFKPGVSKEELEGFLAGMVAPLSEINGSDKLRAWALKKGIVSIEFAALAKTETQVVDPKERARQVYRKAKNVVIGVMEEARLGNLPESGPVFDAVHELTDVLLSDTDALLGLTMIKNYDEYTFTHSVNVGTLSIALARELGIEEPHLTDIGFAGLMHDVGKTMTPIDILNKPAKLTPEEWEVMQEHPVHSFKIVKDMVQVSEYAIAAVRQHHCRFDRTGYPSLEQDEHFIPGAQIVAIADCYDGMTTQRQYQKCFDPKESLEIMVTKLAGSSLNPKFLQTFIRMLGIYPIGSLVRLDTGEIGLVTERRTASPTLPMIKLIQDPDGNLYGEASLIDLSDDENNRDPLRHIVAEVNSDFVNIDLTEHL